MRIKPFLIQAYPITLTSLNKKKIVLTKLLPKPKYNPNCLYFYHMPNNYFTFKQFNIDQSIGGFRVSTDACILGAWAAVDTAKSILDIGTGTGLLALMLAQRHPLAEIHAVEMVAESAAQAQVNFAHSPWHTRIELHEISIQEFAAKSDQAFDLICVNPPFFHQHLKGTQGSKNIAIHNDTLTTNDLVTSIQKLLALNGQAFVLYPEYESRVFEQEANSKGLSTVAELLVYNKPQSAIFRRIIVLCKNVRPMKSEELYIRDHEGNYTVAFKKLIADYYL
jgi:tRNA1Val (adenine37-N6)-methyltransferase